MTYDTWKSTEAADEDFELTAEQAEEQAEEDFNIQEELMGLKVGDQGIIVSGKYVGPAWKSKTVYTITKIDGDKITITNPAASTLIVEAKNFKVREGWRVA